MTKKEAAKLLELIQLAWPKYYKDMPDDKKLATINMWQLSFSDLPYPIMEQAFNHFRMVSKFPPTVAEMVEELKQLHYQATECALVCKGMGQEDMVLRYKAIMDCTARYKDLDSFWGSLQGCMASSMITGGAMDVQRLGTPGDRLGRENGLPVLDAGEGRYGY